MVQALVTVNVTASVRMDKTFILVKTGSLITRVWSKVLMINYENTDDLRRHDALYNSWILALYQMSERNVGSSSTRCYSFTDHWMMNIGCWLLAVGKPYPVHESHILDHDHGLRRYRAIYGSRGGCAWTYSRWFMITSNAHFCPQTRSPTVCPSSYSFRANIGYQLVSTNVDKLILQPCTTCIVRGYWEIWLVCYIHSLLVFWGPVGKQQRGMSDALLSTSYPIRTPCGGIACLLQIPSTSVLGSSWRAVRDIRRREARHWRSCATPPTLPKPTYSIILSGGQVDKPCSYT